MIGLAFHLGAVFVAAWVTVSLLVGAATRAMGTRLSQVEPRARVRLFFAALVSPLVVSALVVIGVAFPHSWLGLVDHCSDHPGHLHLCFLHGAPAPDPLVGTVVMLGAAWSFFRLSASAHDAWRGAGAVRRVLSASRRQGSLRVLPGEAPLAFTVGLRSPTVVVSRAVLAAPHRWRAVLEHERSHVENRDPLMRWLAALCTAFHAPGIGSELVAYLREAQEFAADDTSAHAVGSRILVAETLVEWMRWNHGSDSVGFHSDPLAARVQRLLDPGQQVAGPSNSQLMTATAALVAAIALNMLPLHHAVETLLGIILS